MLLDIPPKELPGTQQLIDPLAVIAAAGDLMRCIRVAYIFNWPAKRFKAVVQHFTLHETGAAVVVAMEYDIGLSLIHI